MTIGMQAQQQRQRIGIAILLTCWAWFLLAKVIASYHFIGPLETVYDISFGFGDYIRSLVTSGQYQSCMDGLCYSSARMPLLPLIYALIAQFTDHLLTATLIKNVLMSIMVLVVFRKLLRLHVHIHRHALAIWCVITPILVLSPSVIKHAAYPHYEEGFLIELIFLWSYSFLLSTLLICKGELVRGRPAIVLTIVLGITAFFLKSSMIAVLGVTYALGAVWLIKGHDLRVCSALVLGAIIVLSWGIRNEITSGSFRFGTSWEGPNAFRAWNDESYQLYPDVVLDRLFDSDIAYKENGEATAIIVKLDASSFENEWDQNDYYLAHAHNWILSHPADAADFLAIKAFNLFVGVRKTPYTYNSDARERVEVTNFQEEAIRIWLILGRMAQIFTLILLAKLWMERDKVSRVLVLSVVAVNSAYAMPYLVGFSYERHVSIFLLLVFVSMVFLIAQLATTAANRTQLTQLAE